MPAETTLTARQQEIWQFLVTYVDGHGYPPTVREIGEEVGLASPSTVHAHLANLERVGLIRRDPTKPRATGRAVASGEPPSPLNPPSGCRFRTRCPRAQQLCADERPLLRELGPGHEVACHFPEPVDEPSASTPPSATAFARS